MASCRGRGRSCKERRGGEGRGESWCVCVWVGQPTQTYLSGRGEED